MANIQTKDTSIKGMLISQDSAWGKELAKALPSPKSVGRFMSVCLAQLADPKVGGALARCSSSSFFNCILKSARNDILPDGVNAFLIPYSNTCTLQISARGFCDWLKRHGVVKDINGYVVHENDEFEMDMGVVKRHTFDFRNTGRENEKIMGVWCRAVLPDGTTKDMWMGVSDIEKVRQCAQSDNVWSKWYDQMAIKSCIKRLVKTLENTPALENFLAVDNEGYAHPDERKPRIDAGDLLGSGKPKKGDAPDGEVIDIPDGGDETDDGSQGK